jgi:hypothetical protein
LDYVGRDLATFTHLIDALAVPDEDGYVNQKAVEAARVGKEYVLARLPGAIPGVPFAALVSA